MTDNTNIEEANQNTGGQQQDPQTDDNTTNEELEKLKAELANMTDAAKRAIADLQNVQKRSNQERLQLYPQAQADLMISFLPIINNFERAFQHIPEKLAKNEWVKGVQAIETQFQSILTQVGLTVINPENSDFDPNEHEAMLEAPGPKNKVIQVLEKGYKLKDHVISPAKISVGSGE